MKQITDISAGVVIVKQEVDGWNFLLLQSFGYWDFPKGGIEAGEESLEAATREVKEETTITELHFNWGYEYCECKPYKDGHKIARYYLAETHQENIELPINPQLGYAEHDAYQWMNFQEAYPLLSMRVRHVMIWAREILEGIPEVKKPLNKPDKILD